MAEQRQELKKNSHNIFQCDYYRDCLFLFSLCLLFNDIQYWSTIITIIMIINYSAGYGWQSTSTTTTTEQLTGQESEEDNEWPPLHLSSCYISRLLL